MSSTNSKDIENQRWLAQCALLDNMYEMSLVMGSPYPGSTRGIPPDDISPTKSRQAGVKLTGAPDANGASKAEPNSRSLVTAAKCIPENAVLYQAPPEYTLAHLNNTKDAERFFEATPAQLSSFVPKILLEVKQDGKWEKVEFASSAVAKDYKNKQRLLLSSDVSSNDQSSTDFVKKYLGDDYLAQGGIKRFDFSFDNNMFYEKNIKATLELHFQSAADLGLGIYRRLFRLSDGKVEGQASKDPSEFKSHKDVKQDIINCAVLLRNAAIQGLSFGADAFSKQGGDGLGVGGIELVKGESTINPDLKSLRVSPNLASGANMENSIRGVRVSIPDAWLNDETPVTKTHRAKYLRCTIGWNALKANIEGFDDELENAIRNTQRTFILNMTDYDVDFKEDGQVAITFNYIASIDSYTRQAPRMDILENIFTTRVETEAYTTELETETKVSYKPHEYKYSLVPVPSDSDIKALYRPLAPYGIIGSNYADLVGGGGVPGVTRKIDPNLVLNLNPDTVETLSFSGRSKQDLINKLTVGRAIEGSATSVTTGDVTTTAGAGFQRSRAKKRMDNVTGGGYIITRLVTQFEDPFGTGKKVFQVQEKAVQLEMSLIEKEIRAWRDRKRPLKNKEKDPVWKQCENNIKQLQRAHAVAKKILISARQFRKITQATGFFKALNESGLLRMAKTVRENVFEESGDSVPIKEYQKGGVRATVDFFPIGRLTGREAEAKKKLGQYMARVVAEKSYGSGAGVSNALTGAGINQGDDTFISFIQFGHLLSHLFGSEEGHPYYGLMLGTIKLPHPVTKEKIVYNISDIPISMSNLTQWYFNKVIDTGRESYAFRSAMRDLLTTIIKPMLSKYCVGQYLPKGEPPPTINFSTISVPFFAFQSRGMMARRVRADFGRGYFDPGSYPLGYQAKKNNFAWKNTFKKADNRFHFFAYDAGHSTITGLWDFWKNMSPGSYLSDGPYAGTPIEIKNYYVLYATTPCDRAADYNKDMKQGIYHLTLGSDKGILKRIKFKRKEMPYLEAMNIENASGGNLDGLLTIPMDADVELVGNNFFRNGQMIYINAEMGMGKVLAHNMRIGGYYMITKVSNSIDNTGWVTNLNCIWQSSEYSDTSWGGDP